jgi:hypothetical protein
MKGAKTMNKLRFVAAVASLAASVAVLYGDSYDSYVHLNAKEGPTNPSFFDNTSGHWQKKNEEGVFQAVAEGPHSGEKYYVPTGSYLATSNVIATAASPIEYVFGGEELAVAGRFYEILKRSGHNNYDAFIEIPNLVLLPGGEIYSAAADPAVLKGECTVYGTSSNPSCWYNYAKSGRPVFRSTLLGEADSVFYFKNQDSASEGYVTIFRYDGDASGFFGTMRLIGNCSRLTAATPDGFAMPGTVEIKDGAQFDIPAGDVATIGNLRSDGGTVRIGADDKNSRYAKLVVTNCVEANGKPILLSFERTFSSNAVSSCRLIELLPDSPDTLSVEDFILTNFVFAADEPVASLPLAYRPNIRLSVVEDDDGTRALAVSKRKFVYQVKSEKDANSCMFSAADTWSDNAKISSGNDYYLCFANQQANAPEGESTFGGASMTLCGPGTFYLRMKPKIDYCVPDFRWIANSENNPIVQVYNSAATLRGKLTIPYADGNIARVNMWNGGNQANGKDYTYIFTIASDICGDGTLGLSLNGSAASDARAFYAITGLNTNFTGRIHLFHDSFGGGNAGMYAQTPDKYCVTLYVSDPRNLGGVKDEFDPQALLISDHSLLKTAGSLVFDEPTRGWSVKGVGRVHVESGETLTVTNKQITYSGEFRKEGKGILKLGGTARFAEEASEEPLPGTNILRIADGGLMPADATAFDGLEVRFDAGAKLVIDAAAEGDLARYGMYNVNWNVPVSVDGGAALPVEFSLPDDFDKEACHRFGLLTVSPSVADGMDAQDFAISVPKGMKFRISKVENADEDGVVKSVTFTCDLAPCAFIIVVR